jgi:hypothetical protein
VTDALEKHSYHVLHLNLDRQYLPVVHIPGNFKGYHQLESQHRHWEGRVIAIWRTKQRRHTSDKGMELG